MGRGCRTKEDPRPVQLDLFLIIYSRYICEEKGGGSRGRKRGAKRKGRQ